MIRFFDMPNFNFKSIEFILKFIQKKIFRSYYMPGTVLGNRNIAVTNEIMTYLINLICTRW